MRSNLGSSILALQSTPAKWQMCWLVRSEFSWIILVTLTLEKVWINKFTTSFPITNFFLILFFPGKLVYYIYPAYMEDKDSGPKMKTIFPLLGGGIGLPEGGGNEVGAEGH